MQLGLTPESVCGSPAQTIDLSSSVRRFHLKSRLFNWDWHAFEAMIFTSIARETFDSYKRNNEMAILAHSSIARILTSLRLRITESNDMACCVGPSELLRQTNHIDSFGDFHRIS